MSHGILSHDPLNAAERRTAQRDLGADRRVVAGRAGARAPRADGVSRNDLVGIEHGDRGIVVSELS
jgi:hypothetical protein